MSSSINLPIYQLLFLLSSFPSVAFALPDQHNPDVGNSKRNKVSIVEERSGRNVTVLEHAATGVTLEHVTARLPLALINTRDTSHLNQTSIPGFGCKLSNSPLSAFISISFFFSPPPLFV